MPATLTDDTTLDISTPQQLYIDRDTTLTLTVGEIAAALHLSGGRLCTTMIPRRTYLTGLLMKALDQVGMTAVRELAAATAAIEARYTAGHDTPQDDAALRRLWRGVERDHACQMFARALVWLHPLTQKVPAAPVATTGQHHTREA
jgi:hypothetical protein